MVKLYVFFFYAKMARRIWMFSTQIGTWMDDLDNIDYYSFGYVADNIIIINRPGVFIINTSVR